MPSVLCAVSHGLYQPWLDILRDGQEETWLRDQVPDNIEIVHFHGTPLNRFFHALDQLHERIRWSNRYVYRVLKMLDNALLKPWMNYTPITEKSSLLKSQQEVLHIRFPDAYLTYRWKLLGLMDFFFNHTNHDYLFTTTTASYINLKVLSQKILEFEPGDTYFGALPYEGADFVSGSNRIFSRETVEKVLLAKSEWKPGIIEDLAVGQLLLKLGIQPTFVPIINISSMQELESFEEEAFRKNYHFRLKSGPNSKRDDVRIMRAFHSRYGCKE
jgi:hypothetical protein